MNKIPLKEAIEAGAWLECHAKWCSEELYFRFRVTGFRRSSVEEIDRSKVNDVLVEGLLWLLSLEAVNLANSPVGTWKLRYAIKLVDQDGFEFEPLGRTSLDSDEQSGLRQFSGWSSNTPLSPQAKASGSIPFALPDEESNYYLAIKDGSICEA